VEAEYHKSLVPKPSAPSKPNLSVEHRRELQTGSDIAPHVVAERGYSTITESEALSLGFSEDQARSGLLIPFYTPCGKLSYQLKPHNPRVGLGKPIKYETRAGRDIVLDVHPSNYHRLLHAHEAIYVIEGIKKADCGASRGLLTVGLSGVWNWGKKRKRGGAKYGRPGLLGDWGVIPLEGRTVYICFDADYREKQNVALAMLRLAERLTERGAHVYIMELPGPEKGLDDYVVAGGDLERLEREARPFTPSNLIGYAAKPDARIHRCVGRISAAMRLDEWKRTDATAHSLLRTLLELALLGGRYDKDTDSVEVMIGTRELIQYAGIGCRKTLTRNTAKLQKRGYIEKVPGDRSKGRANRYILKLSNMPPGIEIVETSSPLSITGGDLDNFAPHLRWHGPTGAKSGEDERDSKLPREGASPENPYHLKPKQESIYEGQEVPQIHAEGELSLGKTVEMALHLLLSWGGEGTLKDLSTATGINHTGKLRAKLEACGGVFELDPKGKHGARVRLVGDWRRRLDARRESGGEFRRSRQQAVRNRQARESFRNDAPADPTPELAGPEKAAQIVAKAEEHDREARIEEQRAKVGMTAEVFLADALQDVTGFDWRELRALWIGKGGVPEDLRRAVKDPYRFNREGGKGALYVERRMADTDSVSVSDHEPAPVAVLRETENLRKPETESPPAEDWRSHPLACECQECLSPMPTRYARAWRRT
jgi:putative DNA primase/helicase